MLNVQTQGNVVQNTSVPVMEIPKNIKNLTFKAGEQDSFVKAEDVPMIKNQDVIIKQMIAEQKKKEKQQKLKQNVSWGIGIASGVAIIAMVLMQLKMMKGGDTKKLNALKKQIENIKDPGIKREAEEEFARQAYERSIYRIEDLIQLDKLAATVEKREPANIGKTKLKMDTDVVGMDEAKQPILDFLESINYDITNNLKDGKPVILALDGPPGTGKSTLMKTISDALGYYFKKISLGGTKNIESLTGFERTYAGATPGLFAKAQLEGNTKKVVFGLDELEKADEKVLNMLLPILDDQKIFTDRYYNSNIDLSQSIFVVTTNMLERLRGTPIYDRIKPHVINIKPYDVSVKTKIAEQKLSNLLKENLLTDKVSIAEDVCAKIAEITTDQGGRETTQIVDKLITELKKQANYKKNGEKVEINADDIVKLFANKS